MNVFIAINCMCAQVSEVDMTGAVLRSFTDVEDPYHLSLDSEGHLLVADRDNNNDRILLLNSQLELQRVLIDRNSQVAPWGSRRLCFNEPASQLYVLHSSSSSSPWRDTISVYNLR